MQLIFAALAAAACIALGTLAAKRLSERERLLNTWEDVLQRLETRIISGGEALPRLFRECTRGTGLLLEKAAEAWENAPALSMEKWLEQLPFEPMLTFSEQDTLQKCLAGLAAPHLERQLQALSFAREQWQQFRRIGREARENNTRLYMSLGWLAGAAVFILIC